MGNLREPSFAALVKAVSVFPARGPSTGTGPGAVNGRNYGAVLIFTAASGGGLLASGVLTPGLLPGALLYFVDMGYSLWVFFDI